MPTVPLLSLMRFTPFHHPPRITSPYSWHKLAAKIQKLFYSRLFLNSSSQSIGENYTEGYWDGSRFELASCEFPNNNNNIVKGLKHCASKTETEIAVLYFPKSNFVESDVTRAIGRYYGLKTTLGDGFKDFVGIFVVCGDKVYKMK